MALERVLGAIRFYQNSSSLTVIDKNCQIMCQLELNLNVRINILTLLIPRILIQLNCSLVIQLNCSLVIPTNGR
jgi:hypothetical protein